MLVVLPQLLHKSVNAIAIYPFIILRNKSQTTNKELINHEKIHFHQQKELLFFIFFAVYTIEFLLKWVKYKNSNLAYFNISFEREAYLNQNDLGYLKRRNFFAFFKYI